MPTEPALGAYIVGRENWQRRLVEGLTLLRDLKIERVFINEEVFSLIQINPFESKRVKAICDEIGLVVEMDEYHYRRVIRWPRGVGLKPDAPRLKLPNNAP